VRQVITAVCGLMHRLAKALLRGALKRVGTRKMCYLGVLPAVCLAAPRCASAGYEVSGCLVYTVLDQSRQPSGKKVILFRVSVCENDWHIYIEPALARTNGIAFHDGSLAPPDSTLILTGFPQSRGLVPSPFDRLRAEVQVLKKDEINFSNPPVVIPPAIARFLKPAPGTNAASGPTIAGKTAANAGDILAEAAVFKGAFPPADPSYVGLLRFAFVPPGPGSPQDLLPQVWDDGNPRQVRFRYARWRELAGSSGLIAKAEFQARGKQMAADGKLVDLPDSKKTAVPAIEAAYEVESTTNVGNLTLPLSFKLTRFAPVQPPGGQPSILTTDAATVLSVREVTSTEPLNVALPGKTVVSDFRASRELNGAPLVYVVDSGTMPALSEVEGGLLYKAAARGIRKKNIQAQITLTCLVTVLLLPPIVFTLLRKSHHSWSSGSRLGQKPSTFTNKGDPLE
jgi:hypothetical protein